MSSAPTQSSNHLSLDRLVSEAAEQITRFGPADAFAASEVGALIIDIRSSDARELLGMVPGSMHIPLTVLEWRVALDSQWRNPHLGGLEQQLILICDHGCSSTLAASNLVRLGFHRAGDVVGGFEAWKRHGLPVTPLQQSRPDPGVLPGMGPAE